MIDNIQVKNIIEAVLAVADEPLNVEKLQAVFEEHERPTAVQINDIIQQLQEDYATGGIELKKIASGYRFQARQDYATWISRLWEEKAPRYSKALLETLAIIAYRQPVTRAEIEDIRGVAVSTTMMKTLLERNWVRVVGHRDVPGKPGIYATTKSFLDYFNLTNLDELPSLQEIKDNYISNLNVELPFDRESSHDLELQDACEELATVD